MKHNKYILIFIQIYSVCLISQTKTYDNIRKLECYIASEKFLSIKENNSYYALDSILAKAMEVCDNDIIDALFCATFATLPYNYFYLNIKFFRIKINLPSSEFFYYARKNLPSKIFFDSPNDEFGDKDKIAHFFGFALLAYLIDDYKVLLFFGSFVEEFEKCFISKSEYDIRDQYANFYGILFGSSLKKNIEIKPSEILILHIIRHKFY